MDVIWAPLARGELGAAVAYVAAENPSAAKRLDDLVRSAVELLRTSPHAGRPSAVKGRREFTVSRTRYRLVYKVEKDAVLILRVIHSARDWP